MPESLLCGNKTVASSTFYYSSCIQITHWSLEEPGLPLWWDCSFSLWAVGTIQCVFFLSAHLGPATGLSISGTVDSAPMGVRCSQQILWLPCNYMRKLSCSLVSWNLSIMGVGVDSAHRFSFSSAIINNRPTLLASQDQIWFKLTSAYLCCNQALLCPKHRNSCKNALIPHPPCSNCLVAPIAIWLQGERINLNLGMTMTEMFLAITFSKSFSVFAIYFLTKRWCQFVSTTWC